jgi:hypothetical protein
MKYWGKLGAFWSGIWSLLIGEPFFWMPGVGPILVCGSLVSTIVSPWEGATIHNGLTALGSWNSHRERGSGSTSAGRSSRRTAASFAAEAGRAATAVAEGAVNRREANARGTRA